VAHGILGANPAASYGDWLNKGQKEEKTNTQTGKGLSQVKDGYISRTWFKEG